MVTDQAVPEKAEDLDQSWIYANRLLLTLSGIAYLLSLIQACMDNYFLYGDFETSIWAHGIVSVVIAIMCGFNSKDLTWISPLVLSFSSVLLASFITQDNDTGIAFTAVIFAFSLSYIFRSVIDPKTGTQSTQINNNKDDDDEAAAFAAGYVVAGGFRGGF